MAHHLNQHVQIGNIGKIKELGPNLMISVASTNSYKDGQGEWINNAEWIEHTIFSRQEKRIKWARENLQPGDLVQVTSRPFQTVWTSEEGRQFGITFAVEDLQLLTSKTK